MITNNSNRSEHCDDEVLDAVLSGSEEIHNHQDVIEHIESCEDCQQRFDELAACEQDWSKARRALLSETPLAMKDFDSAKWDFVLRGEETVAWTESMASQLLSPPAHPELLGKIGRYDVERLIGTGGMGIVFKGFDTELNRPVAIKILAPYLAGIGSARQRFAREARAAAAVVHDHVVPIHNVETERETPFLVMKYIGGESLQNRIDREGALELCEILRIGIQVASGLAAAHKQGLVHRDIKPSNILLDHGVERALITDFGLARAADDASLTQTGFHPGTPQYMSPEQASGEPVDVRSDLFSLGSVLYTMSTGRPPFRAETSLGVLRRITDVEPREIQEINPAMPVWLCSIIKKLMAKRVVDRYQSADEVAELLSGCLAHVQLPRTIPLPEELVVKTSTARRNDFPPFVKWIAAAAFAFSVFLACVLVIQEQDKGTLKIECDVDTVSIRVIQGDKVVEKLTVTKSGKTLRIASGSYVIAIDDSSDNVKLRDDSVTIERGGTKILKIGVSPNATDALVPIDSYAFAQTAAPRYLLDKGDILGVYIEGVLPYTPTDLPPKPPTVSSSDQDPGIGFPIVVQENGTISLPSIQPISVKGLTIEQVTELIRKKYLEAKIFSNPFRLRPIVTKLQARTYEVIVLRQDPADDGIQNRTTGNRIKLAAYKNDILNLLMASGGMPGANAKDEIKILRARNATQENRNSFLSEFYQKHYLKKDLSNCPPLPDHPDILKIPLRLPMGVAPNFKPEDILLEDGDVVYVEHNGNASELRAQTGAQQLKEITNSIGMKLVRINPGTFAMGLQAGSPGRSDAEELHEIAITKTYYLGVFEVTQESYEKVMRYNPSQARGGLLPVEMVSWMDAVQFCDRLSELPEEKAAGRIYRLPTEAEWEYACRASSGSAFSFGDIEELLEDHGWFDKNSERKTHPVGMKRPNRWGLYDMHGNVCEWCQDWYQFQPSSVEVDPKGPDKGTLRVLRGGSWRQSMQYCTSGYRYASDHRSPICGFRVAMSLPEEVSSAASTK